MSGPLKIDNTSVTPCLIRGDLIETDYHDCSMGAAFIGVVVAAALVLFICYFFSGYGCLHWCRLWGGANSYLSTCFSSSDMSKVSCVQVWYYHTMYPKDPWYLKLLVEILPSVLRSTLNSLSRLLGFWPSTPHTRFWSPIQVRRRCTLQTFSQANLCSSSLHVSGQPLR